MLRVYKFFKHYSSTTTIPVGSYKFHVNKKIKDLKSIKYDTHVLIGSTESHAKPIRSDQLKVSIFKKNDEKLKLKLKEKEMENVKD
jgi:hypothetical protein